MRRIATRLASLTLARSVIAVVVAFRRGRAPTRSTRASPATTAPMLAGPPDGSIGSSDELALCGEQVLSRDGHTPPGVWSSATLDEQRHHVLQAAFRSRLRTRRISSSTHRPASRLSASRARQRSVRRSNTSQLATVGAWDLDTAAWLGNANWTALRAWTDLSFTGFAARSDRHRHALRGRFRLSSTRGRYGCQQRWALQDVYASRSRTTPAPTIDGRATVPTRVARPRHHARAVRCDTTTWASGCFALVVDGTDQWPVRPRTVLRADAEHRTRAVRGRERCGLGQHRCRRARQRRTRRHAVRAWTRRRNVDRTYLHVLGRPRRPRLRGGWPVGRRCAGETRTASRSGGRPRSKRTRPRSPARTTSFCPASERRRTTSRAAYSRARTCPARDSE